MRRTDITISGEWRFEETGVYWGEGIQLVHARVGSELGGLPSVLSLSCLSVRARVGFLDACHLAAVGTRREQMGVFRPN